MSATKITTEEWLTELAAASAKDDEGLTCAEWAKRLGLSGRVTRERLHAAFERGWLRVGKRRAIRMDGTPSMVPVYRIERPAKRQSVGTSAQVSRGRHK